MRELDFNNIFLKGNGHERKGEKSKEVSYID